MAAAVVGAGVYYLRGPSLPAPGSEPYEQISRAFYHGLAALEVGLLDDARQQFTRATTLVPEEPAAWANLGLTQLRLGELDAAAAPVERALQLAPSNVDIAMLAGRMEVARGRLDEAVARLRGAVALDARALQPRFALADELQRAGTPDADREAAALYDELAMLAPANLAVLLERARLAARMSDRARLDDSVSRVAAQAEGWPDIAREQLAALREAAAASRFPDAARATTLLRNVLARVTAFSESLAAVRTPAELIAAPLDRFVALEPAAARPAAADTALSFTRELLAGDTPLALVAVDAARPGAVDLYAEAPDGLRRVGAAPIAAAAPRRAGRRGARLEPRLPDGPRASRRRRACNCCSRARTEALPMPPRQRAPARARWAAPRLPVSGPPTSTWTATSTSSSAPAGRPACCGTTATRHGSRSTRLPA